MIAWGAVGYFMYVIMMGESMRADTTAVNVTQLAHNAQLSRVGALALKTAGDRARLASLVQVNPVSLVSAIQTSGNAIGSSIQISNASSANLPVPLSTKGVDLAAFSFTAQTKGAFPSLIRTLELLETLPVPSSVQAINIARVPTLPGTTVSDPWHIEVQVHVLTTARISS